MSTAVFTQSAIFSSSSLLQPSTSLPLSSTTSVDDFAWDEHNEEDRLGEGRFGTVFKAIRRTDGLTVALKRLRIFDMDEKSRVLCLREADLLLRLQHEHIVQLLDVFLHAADLWMVMEYADIGDMDKLITDMRHKRLRFTEEDMWRFVYCIASGLAYMHSQRMMHRDIKPANIYVSKSGEVKVGDLGLGRILDAQQDKAASVVGTPYYMSPEVISEEPYSYKTDIWSLGCLVYEMAMLKVPFEGTNLYSLGMKIQNCTFPPVDDIYSNDLIAFVHTLLQRNPDARPSAAEIITTSLVMLHKISSQQAAAAALHSSSPTSLSSSSTSSFTPSSSALSSPSSSPPSPSSTIDPFSDLQDLGIIGRGQYSAVHKARRRSDGRLVAVKQVQIYDMDSDGRRECVNETRILASLSHPNIIQYLNYFTHDNDLYLILELAEMGDLSAVIEAAQQQGVGTLLDERAIWQYIVQIASALQFMHARRIMHRDIKPSNVFLTSARQVKLGDLGLGRFMSSNTIQAFSEVGTPFYMSPEAISGTGYSFASDIWALGCLLYELTTLSSPFYQHNTSFWALGNRIKECQYNPLPHHTTRALRQLVASILTPHPEHRPTAAQVCAIAQAACRAYELGTKPDVEIKDLPQLIERAERRGLDVGVGLGLAEPTRMEREAEEKTGERVRVESPCPSDVVRPKRKSPSKERPVVAIRTSPRTSPKTSPSSSPTGTGRERGEGRRSPAPARGAASAAGGGGGGGGGVMTRAAAAAAAKKIKAVKEEEKESRR